MPDETVIYRLEVMSIMTMIGDIRNELMRVRAALEEEDDGEEDDDEN